MVKTQENRREKSSLSKDGGFVQESPCLDNKPNKVEKKRIISMIDNLGMRIFVPM